MKDQFNLLGPFPAKSAAYALNVRSAMLPHHGGQIPAHAINCDQELTNEASNLNTDFGLRRVIHAWNRSPCTRIQRGHCDKRQKGNWTEQQNLRVEEQDAI